MSHNVALLNCSIHLLDRAKNLGIPIVLIQPKSRMEPFCVEMADHLLVYQDGKEDEAEFINFLCFHNVHEVLTLSEASLDLCWRLNTKLNNNTPPYPKVFKDKFFMREFLSETPFGNVKYQVVSTEKELAIASEYVSFPIVLKPVSGSGSKGVIMAYDKSYLKLSSSSPHILEELILGDEFSVESVVTDKQRVHLAVTKKQLFDRDGGCVVERGHFILKLHNQMAEKDIIRNFVDGVLQKIEAAPGVYHTEVIVRDDIVHLVEIHKRVGGDCIPDLVAQATGVDLYTVALQIATGRSVEVTQTELRGEAGILYLDKPEGLVSMVSGESILRTMPSICTFQINFSTGSYIKRPLSSSERIGYVQGFSFVRGKINAILQEAQNVIQVAYD
ncbi:hypothetical protein C9J12_21350 [Photobacterium frigidiphilum]|uniref:ATP-grasp domain-containing protein n=1 Tax=Photobacterium frigidiphilum TaxID=264736 RepID=A0A2T3JAB7_9GAMM|nr:ATP-grasp domain-containing protein [Photobacterium frigidiphilum]PSU45788.1 hypothetical protein C9J12_21350 [Photobacterium frigidiphilum]